MLMKDVAKNYKKAPGKHGRDDTSTEVYGKTVERRYLPKKHLFFNVVKAWQNNVH